MLNIEILLSKNEKATDAIAEALQSEIEKKLAPVFDDLFVRVRVGYGKKCEVSGGTKDEKEQALEMIENIFYSDDWLPEQKYEDMVEVVMAPKQPIKRPNLKRR